MPSISIALMRSTSAPGKVFSIPNRTPIFFTESSMQGFGRGLPGDLEIGLQHSLPPGPVVACVVAPYIETARDAFVAEDLRHAFVVVPTLVVNAGGEDVVVTAVTIEIPGVADVGEVVHGDVEVAVVVVVAAEKVGG